MTTKADEEVGEQQGDMRGTLPGAFVTTTAQPSDFTSNTMEATQPEPGTSAESGSVLQPSSNLAAQPDSYSMFQHLMEAQVFCKEAYEHN